MALTLLSTGVPGLDDVFSGGLPEYSFNLIAGAPGSGKTTLAHQITFANASAERPALYFTVLGEPALKMLRYQQQMGFFDPDKVGTLIRFIDLSREVLDGDLAAVLDRMVEHVEQTSPGLIVVDSFRTVVRAKSGKTKRELELQDFLQRLAMHLTSWQVTSFLVGEYGEGELHDNPVFTIADGILWLTQSKERSSIVRKLEVMKVRGMPASPGLHTFRISSSGIQVFPRTSPIPMERPRLPDEDRRKFGIPRLDRMLGGGVRAGDATLLAGPSGTGKTMLSTQFIAEGARQGQPGVIAVFEEYPDEYISRANDIGLGFDELIRDGLLQVVSVPMDLSVDETLYEVQKAVAALGAERLAIDSLSGLELALAANSREEYRESLYRVLRKLTGGGVTVLLTVEVTEAFDRLRFTPHAISFIAQNIVFLRYVEVESRLQKVLAVLKMRRSEHSRDLHGYEITSGGIELGEPLVEYEGILTGAASLRARQRLAQAPGLTAQEAAMLERLHGVHQASAVELAAALGVGVDHAARALGRLVALNYATEHRDGEEAVYRAIGRPLE